MVLVQVASSGSEVPELAAQVSKIAMRINSLYSTLTHQPLVFLQQDISYSQFLALLSVAEIFMATNLREGLNLTSHDFIHCQDGELYSQKHGSLILSEFTGSASIFAGHEFLVNPWDYKQCADAIHTALNLSPEQKQRNWQSLLDRKSPYTALAWYTSLRSALTEAHNPQQSRDTHAIAPVTIDSLQHSYNAAQTRLLFLEDGTMFSHPCETTIDTLQALALDQKNMIYLTSNRSPEQLDSTAQLIQAKLGLIAENGYFIKYLSNTGEWKALVDVAGPKDWRAGIRKVMEYFHERTEGSVIEERRCSLTFHYDHATDSDIAAHQASELADQITGARGSEAIRVVRDATAVTVEPLHISKATAALSIMNRLSDDEYPDFVLVVGGSRGDETLFRWANRLESRSDPGLGKTLAVTTLTTGTHATEAEAKLPPGLELEDMLRSLLPPEEKIEVNGLSIADD